MDVLLICNYWHFEFEKTSSRYRTLADMIVESGINLEVVTSSFRHQTKEQRNLKVISKIASQYKVTLLYEPGYKKNISLIRIRSHAVFAKEVIKYLRRRKKPDLIICSVPSLAVGDLVTAFAEKNRIKVIVDIQDLWPEAFKMAIDIPIISDILFAPMMKQANRIYSRADRIMAVSETYVERGLKYNKKDDKGLAVFIGTDSKLVKTAEENNIYIKPEGEFWIGYVGALGHSYDIRIIIKAIQQIVDKGIKNIVFKIMGDGVLMNEFKRYAEAHNVNCDFTGFLEYGNMMAMLRCCDVAVNPIVGNSVSSIINKVSDYAMAGVPVINTQNSDEYRKMLEDYNCGINCENGNVNSIAKAILKLYYDKDLKTKMSANSYKLGSEKFDRRRTYTKVRELIEEMVQE